MLDSGTTKTVVKSKRGLQLTGPSDKIIIVANGGELAASNYARDHKKNKMVQNNISIVISPLSDEDANEDKAKCSNPNNNNNQNDKYKLKTEETLPAREQSSEKTIDLSIFELLDHSSKKFILKPATMGLTIKSQVFRQKVNIISILNFVAFLNYPLRF